MGFYKEFISYLKADQDIVAKRVDYCKKCPYITSKFKCTKCGCFMKLKTLIALARCPIGKW